MGFPSRAVLGVPADDAPPGRPRPVVWLAPSVLTLALALVGLDRAQLWRDELATWSAASRPVPDLFRLTGHVDALSAPYYLLMHGWTTLVGDSVAALRLPSVLAMTGATAVTARLGQRLAGPRTGFLAGLLFAVAPSTSRYAQEARSYALATLLAVLATLLLFRALDRPTWPRWAGYGAAVFGLGLAHLVALDLVTGHLVAVLLTWRRTGDRRTARWFAAVLPAAVALVPLALIGRGQQTEQLGWVGRPTLGDLAMLPGAVLQSGQVGGLLVGLALLGAVTGAHRPPAATREPAPTHEPATGEPAPTHEPARTGPTGPPAEPLRTGPAGAARATGAAGWRLVLGLSVLLPAVLLFVGGRVSPLWVPRYLVCTVPFLCVLAAGPLARLRLGVALPLVAVAAVVGAPDQFALRRTHEWPRDAPIDYRAAARIIATGQRPGDAVVYAPAPARSSSTRRSPTTWAPTGHGTSCWRWINATGAASRQPSASSRRAAWPRCTGSGCSRPAGRPIRWPTCRRPRPPRCGTPSPCPSGGTSPV
ncbi:glycosyltransferase family 39 protein [Micromonospora zhanjiangensis]